MILFIVTECVVNTFTTENITTVPTGINPTTNMYSTVSAT